MVPSQELYGVKAGLAGASPRLLAIVMATALAPQVAACAPAEGPAGAASVRGATATPSGAPAGSQVDNPYPLLRHSTPTLSYRGYPDAPPTRPPPQPYVNPDGSRTYTNDRAGYALDVPAGWYLGEGRGLVLTSWDIDSTSGHRVDTTAVSKIDVYAEPAGEGQSLDEHVEALWAREIPECGPEATTYTDRQRWTLGDGTEAVRYNTKSCFGTSAHLVARMNGFDVHLVGYFNLAPFDDVARSLRSAR